jgi:hypothetical protein
MIASSSIAKDDSGVFASWKRGFWNKAEDKEYIEVLKNQLV